MFCHSVYIKSKKDIPTVNSQNFKIQRSDLMVKLLSSLLKVEASLTQKNEQKGSFTQDKHKFFKLFMFYNN